MKIEFKYRLKLGSVWIWYEAHKYKNLICFRIILKLERQSNRYKTVNNRKPEIKEWGHVQEFAFITDAHWGKHKDFRCYWKLYALLLIFQE